MLCQASAARGGGGPENVVLVVNANSAGSKEVANHYARLRELPATNVVYLDYDGPLERVSGKRFREEILLPVLEAIDRRGLGLQADMIAYSTDFPWLVNLRGEYPEGVEFSAATRPSASITGATYLFAFLLAKNPGVVRLDTNWYVPDPTGGRRRSNLAACQQAAGVPSRAFRSRYSWLAGGKRAPNRQSGRRYLMATMLGVTTGRGNTVAEVIASLDRAAAAEADPPRGTVYFMRTTGPRSTPRHACYESVVKQLRALGTQAQMSVGSLPRGADDIVGLVTGASKLNLDAANLRVLPGAICDNLTSYGGVLTSKPGHQTPLTDLIRAGATGACGTVAEPLALQAKFPLPTLQVHYRRGCSLAESFYQSVAGPYQLLIVGDPLCQPWVERPELRVAGWPGEDAPAIDPERFSTLGFEQLGIATEPPEPEGPAPDGVEPDQPKDEAEADTPPGPPPVLAITPTVTPVYQGGQAAWELFIDGRLRMRLASGASAEFTAEQLGPGWHDLRCVGVDAGPIEAQERLLGELEVLETPAGPVEPVRLRIDRETIPLSGQVTVTAEAPGAERIVIRQHARPVATIQGASGQATIDAELLGRGPIRLQAVAQPGGAASPRVEARVD